MRGKSNPTMLWPTTISAIAIQEIAVVIEYPAPPAMGSSLGFSAYGSSLNDSVLSSSTQYSDTQCIRVAFLNNPLVSVSITRVPIPVVGFIHELCSFNCFFARWVRSIQFIFICMSVPWVFIMLKNLWSG